MKNWKLINWIAIKPPKDEEKCHMLDFIFSVGFPWSTHCIPMGNDSEPSTSMSWAKEMAISVALVQPEIVAA